MSRSAPKRRRGTQQQTVHADDPVEVTRTDGEAVLGVVQNKHSIRGHCNVCIQTAGGELVTARKRVAVVSGVRAKEARQKAERGRDE